MSELIEKLLKRLPCTERHCPHCRSLVQDGFAAKYDKDGWSFICPYCKKTVSREGEPATEEKK